MNKRDVAEKVAVVTGLTTSKALSAIDAFVGTVTEALREGQKVTIMDFGTFTVNNRRARKGRNPRTGESVSIPPTKAPKFAAGKGFKDKLN